MADAGTRWPKFLTTRSTEGRGKGGERLAPAENKPEVKVGLRQTTEPELSLSRCPWEEQVLRYLDTERRTGALSFPGKLREGIRGRRAAQQGAEHAARFP